MAVTSKKVLVTSSALFAFVDRADPKHNEASSYFRYFAQEKYQVFTNYLDIEETYKLIYEKISPSLARDFLRGVLLSSINIIYPTLSDTNAVLKTLINYGRTELTFKDAEAAVLASRNSIPSICTFEYLHPLFGLTSFFLPI